jgi:hypothetical protein
MQRRSEISGKVAHEQAHRNEDRADATEKRQQMTSPSYHLFLPA